MNKANESAFPTQMWDEELKEATWLDGGLTKRELIAAMAMQALIPTYVEQVKELENAAGAAVEYADALLKELERETK